MKAEDLKKILKKKNSILIGCVVIFLVIFILIDYIFLVRKSYKVLAPGNENGSTEPPIETSTNDTTRFDQKTSVSGDSSSQTTESPSLDNDSPPVVSESKDSSYYYNLGLSLQSEGKYREAVTNYSKAIELDPKQPDYYQRKAEVQVLLGDKDAAIQTVKDGLANNPGDILLQNKLSILQTIVK